MGPERRREPRIPLLRDNVVTLGMENGDAAVCVLANLSVGGMLVDMLWDEMADYAGMDLMVKILDAPQSLGDLLAGAAGRVAWCQGVVCGVQFFQPLAISSQELQARASALGLPEAQAVRDAPPCPDPDVPAPRWEIPEDEERPA